MASRFQEQHGILHNPFPHRFCAPLVRLHQFTGLPGRDARPRERFSHLLARSPARFGQIGQGTRRHESVDLPASHPLLHALRKPFQEFFALLDPPRFTRQPTRNLFRAFAGLFFKGRDQPGFFQSARSALPPQRLSQRQGLHRGQFPHRSFNRVLCEPPGRLDLPEPVDHHPLPSLDNDHHRGLLAGFAHRRQHVRFPPFLPCTEPGVPQVQPSDFQFQNAHRRPRTMDFSLR